MIHIIAGEKGKGKTKHLIERVNNSVGNTSGSVIFLDKNTKHMYEISNKVRLINVTEYPFTTNEGFIGFICGLISQDHDIQEMYIDSFLKVAGVNTDTLSCTINALASISRQFNINFTLSLSLNEADMPEDIKQYIAISL